MNIDNIRLGQQARDQLIRLKRITGIDNWNVLCRWAFCLSLADKNVPPRTRVTGDSAIDMSWKTFAGEYADIYTALLIQRAHEDNRPLSRETLSEMARIHVTRGIGFLTARRQMEGISDLLGIALGDSIA
jgi:DNA sulfur modification protein DndE